MHTKPKHLNFCRFCYLTNKKSTYIFCKLHSLKKWASRIQRLPCWEALGWVSLRVAFLNAAYSFFIHPQKPCLRRSCSRAESGKKKKKRKASDNREPNSLTPKCVTFYYTSQDFNYADPGCRLQPTSRTIQTLCPASEMALVAKIRPHGCHWTPSSSW